MSICFNDVDLLGFAPIVSCMIALTLLSGLIKIFNCVKETALIIGETKLGCTNDKDITHNSTSLLDPLEIYNCVAINNPDRV